MTQRSHRRRFAASLALLAVGTSAPAPLTAQSMDLVRLDAVADSIAHDHLARDRTPGVSIAVARDGEIVFQEGYGMADVELGVAARPETVYRIGSVTKQFTAAGIMQLVEEGSVSLDDPITDYLADFPTQGHSVTVRHLLNHTSGIKSYTGMGPAFWSQARLDLSDAELVELFAAEPFDFEPGEEYLYNNSAYFLLGMILEEITGTPYRAWVEGTVFQPLGMESSRYCDESRILPYRAEGYEYDDGELMNDEFLSMNLPGAAGALCSTVQDLVIWTEALFDGEVVSPESLDLMTTPTRLNNGEPRGYGFGLGLARLEGHRKVAHSGGINGFSSYLAHYPDDGITVAVLTNSGSGGPGAIEEAVARTALGLEIPEPVVDLPMTAEEMAPYEGTYRLQLPAGTLDLRIFADGDQLMSQATGQGANRIRYQGDDVFVPTFDDSVRLVFEMDGGRAVSLTLLQGGAEFQGTRVEG